MEICVLASGSDGNATYVRSGSTCLLVDCGLSLRELTRRLSALGASPRLLDAVILTHEHGDHARGAAVLSKRLDVPVYSSAGTARGAWLSSVIVSETVKAGSSFLIGDLEISPFPVPHDAREPLGFVISDDDITLGLATDLGSVTLEVMSGLSGRDVVVLESNHDPVMLMEGSYPWQLKRWINSPTGHLSNEDAAELLSAISHDRLRHVVLAHLSRVNNEPSLPLASARKALGRTKHEVKISLGWHDRVGETIVI